MVYGSIRGYGIYDCDLEEEMDLSFTYADT